MSIFDAFEEHDRSASARRLSETAAELRARIAEQDRKRKEEISVRLAATANRLIEDEYRAHGLEPVRTPVLISLAMLQKMGVSIDDLRRRQARENRE